MLPPKLTIIIPTYKRAAFLSRAIQSALDVGDVEVIIIPNGKDLSWQHIQNVYLSDDRVHWHPIAEANVSAARNKGLEHAKGCYIKFLDDDDYLCPSNCRKQLEEALAQNIDISSGWLELVNHNNISIKTRKQPSTEDLCEAMLSPQRLTQVGAHLFKREVAQIVLWDLEQNNLEDAKWIVETAIQCEYRWLKCEYVVATWVQHKSFRLSTGHDPGPATLHFFSGVLIEAANFLAASGRLSCNRREAVADGLWSLLQKGLRYDYKYWCSIAKIADGLAEGRRPPSNFHKFPVLSSVPPLWIETALIPFRWAYTPLRKTLDRLNINRN